MLNEKELEEILKSRKKVIEENKKDSNEKFNDWIKEELAKKLKTKNDLLAYANIIEKRNDPEFILFFTAEYRGMIEKNFPELLTRFIKPICDSANPSIINCYVSNFRKNCNCKEFIPSLIKIPKGELEHWRLEALFMIGETYNVFDEITDEILKSNNIDLVYSWGAYLKRRTGSMGKNDKLIKYLFENGDLEIFNNLASQVPIEELLRFSSRAIESLLKKNTLVAYLISGPLKSLAKLKYNDPEDVTVVMTKESIFHIFDLMIEQHETAYMKELLSLNKIYDDFIPLNDVMEYMINNCIDANLCKNFIEYCYVVHSDKESFNSKVPSLVRKFAKLCEKQNDAEAMKLIINYCKEHQSRGISQELSYFDDAMEKLRPISPDLYIKYINDYHIDNKEINTNIDFEKYILENGSIEEVTLLAKARRKKEKCFNVEEYFKSIIEKLESLTTEENKESEVVQNEINSALSFVFSLTDEEKKTEACDLLSNKIYDLIYKIDSKFLIMNVSKKLVSYFKSPTLFIDYLMEVSSEPKYKLMLQVFYEKLYICEQENKDISFVEICLLVSELLKVTFDKTPEKEKNNPTLKKDK